MPDNYREQELDEQKEKIKADLLFAVTPEKARKRISLRGSRMPEIGVDFLSYQGDKPDA